MKMFVYKSLFFFGCILILFKLTVSHEIKKIEEKINYISSAENIEKSKKKIKEELKNSLNKEKIFSQDEAVIIKKFINKIQSELKNAK
jgi:hypothetical protein